VARILIATPLIRASLGALDGHELIEGPPGADPSAEALICDPTQRVGRAEIEAMSALRVISVAGAGSDAVDHDAAAARGIAVLTSGEALVESTADLAFGLIISASRLAGEGERTLREGRWQGWRLIDERLGRDVHGATLALLGYGRIARALARRAAGFDMHVLHHTRTPTGRPGWTGSLDEMLGRCDVLSIHVPLTPSTRGLIDQRRLALLRPTAVLVNTARGPIVDERALARALQDGRLFAAGLDVYDGEPAVSEELLRAPRTVLLPHIGSATRAAREGMLAGAAQKAAEALAR